MTSKPIPWRTTEAHRRDGISPKFFSMVLVRDFRDFYYLLCASVVRLKMNPDWYFWMESDPRDGVTVKSMIQVYGESP
jgi:hypothetical protein